MVTAPSWRGGRSGPQCSGRTGAMPGERERERGRVDVDEKGGGGGAAAAGGGRQVAGGWRLRLPTPPPTLTFLDHLGRGGAPELEHRHGGIVLPGGPAGAELLRRKRDRGMRRGGSTSRPQKLSAPRSHQASSAPLSLSLTRHASNASTHIASPQRPCSFVAHTHTHTHTHTTLSHLLLLSPPSPLKSSPPPRPPPRPRPRCASSPAAAGPSSRHPDGSWRRTQPGRT